MSHFEQQLYHGSVRKSRNVGDALRHALQGLLTALIRERNIRIQLLILLVAVVLCYLLNLSIGQLAVFFGAATLMIVAELFNSALEALADATHPDYDERIQRAKDMSAAAVLLVSLVVLVIAVVIFIPPLLSFFALY